MKNIRILFILIAGVCLLLNACENSTDPKLDKKEDIIYIRNEINSGQNYYRNEVHIR